MALPDTSPPPHRISNMTLIILRIIAFISVMLLIWIIYLANTGIDSILFSLMRVTPYGDKLGHFLVYGFLTLTFNLALNLKLINFAKLNVFIGTAIVFIFVVMEELSQFFIPTRTVDLFDLAISAIGIGFSTFLCFLIKRRTVSTHII